MKGLLRELREAGRSFTFAGVLAVLSLVVAVGSFLYTMRTYAVTHRPYIGIIEQDYRLLGNPPTGMVWRFVMKNVGGLPAWVTVEENRTTVTTAGEKRNLPLLGEPRGGIYMVPGQTADLSGQFTDAGGYVTVADVLSGRTRLEVQINLRYEAAGLWWKKRYHYRAANQFRTSVAPPSFIMVSADAN